MFQTITHTYFFIKDESDWIDVLIRRMKGVSVNIPVDSRYTYTFDRNFSINNDVFKYADFDHNSYSHTYISFVLCRSPSFYLKKIVLNFVHQVRRNNKLVHFYGYF